MFLIGFALIAKSANIAGQVSAGEPHVDGAMIGSFLLVTTALLCLYESRGSRYCALALALCTASLALLGALQGAWAQATLLGAWSFISFRQWQRAVGQTTQAAVTVAKWNPESRFGELLHRYHHDDIHRN